MAAPRIGRRPQTAAATLYGHCSRSAERCTWAATSRWSGPRRARAWRSSYRDAPWRSGFEAIAGADYKWPMLTHVVLFWAKADLTAAERADFAGGLRTL